MGPKESGYLNSIDGYNSKPSLQWTFYEDQASTLTHTTTSFNVVERLET
jgi:hypothetical protein